MTALAVETRRAIRFAWSDKRSEIAGLLATGRISPRRYQRMADACDTRFRRRLAAAEVL